MIKIKFQDKEYLLIGNLESGGAIATEEQYTQGICSYAQLFPDGVIRRYTVPIGTREDITVIGEAEPEINPEAIVDNFFKHESWKHTGNEFN